LIDNNLVDQRGAVFLLELIVRKAQPIVKIYQNYAHHCDYDRIKNDIARLAKNYMVQQDVEKDRVPLPQASSPPMVGGIRKQDSCSWEVASLDTVDSDDEIVAGKKAQSPTLPMTRSGLAAALSATAKPFYPRGRSTKNEDDAAAAAMLESVVTRAHLEGALSPGDAEVAMQLIKSRNTLLFNAHSRFADEPSGLRELVLAVIRAERARRQAVENAHASHDEPSWASLPKPLLNLLQVRECTRLIYYVVSYVFFQSAHTIMFRWQSLKV
jgi:hypothetical protein